MKPLLIAQQLTDIDDKFILGSMPPSVIPSPKPARPKLKAGVIALSAVAAVLSGVLTVGLIVSLVKMGNLNPFAPPDDTEESTVTSESTETESETEAETDPEPPTVYSEGLEFELDPNGYYYVLSMGKCKDSDVAIPPTHEGIPVVGIRGYAFYENEALTSVYVPGSVTDIGSQAFAKCKNLTTVVLAEGVSEIAVMAFANCTALTSVTVPDSISFVSSSVFQGCKALEYEIYDHAEYLGNAGNPYALLVSCPTLGFSSCEVHESTRVIAGSAFEGCANLKSITVPDGIVSVGSNAFKDCDNLTYNSKSSALFLGNADNPFVILTEAAAKSISSCDIPDGTRVIMPYAFRACTKMTSVTIPDTVIFIGDNAFTNCDRLSRVIMPYAFRACTKMTSVTIPDTVIFIGDNAFTNCDRLSRVSIPAGVTKIRKNTFYYCSALAEVSLPDGLTAIGDHAFENCAITSITLPNGLTTIGQCAFTDSNLQSIVLPNSVTSVGSHAFSKCYGLSSVTLSENLTVLSERMFYSCKLTSVVIPEGVTEIHLSAFEFCSYLESVSFPSSLRSLGDNAFLRCHLSTVVIPEGVTHIGDSLFSDCTRLTTVYLPRSLETIGHGPFGSCENVTDVHYAGSEEEWKAVDRGDAWDACFPLGATLHFNSSP